MLEKMITEMEKINALEENKKIDVAVLERVKLWLENLLNDGTELIIRGGVYGANNRVHLTVGFKNYKGEKDFGSSFYLNWEDEMVIVNSSATGHYNKNDIYQIKRVKLINTIWENIEKVEELFNVHLVKYIEVFEDNSNLIYEYNHQQSMLKQYQNEKERKEIEDNLKPNQVYTEKNSSYGTCYLVSCDYKIIKITPKID